LAAYATSVDGRSHSQRHNAVLALTRLNGALIPPGAVFSFNDRVGSFDRDAGYRRAPVSYNGQLINSWGGGVCQASTTTYNAALLAGMEILERHRHEFSPSYAPPGRDAAVAYKAIDLRFRNPYSFPVRISAREDGARLVVAMIGAGRIPAVEVGEKVREVNPPGEIRLGDPSPRARQRNSGKEGYDVAIYRTIGGQKELVSEDSYPAMMRVVQYQ
jgi:vancomycin resistance protein YoaR